MVEGFGCSERPPLLNPLPRRRPLQNYVILSLSKDLGWGRLPNSRPRTAIKTCQLLLAVLIAAFAAMTRLLHRSHGGERVHALRACRDSDATCVTPAFNRVDGRL